MGRGALIRNTVMLRRWSSVAVKVSEVAEKTMCGVTSHSSPGSIPFTDRFMWIVSPGLGGSDRLRALHRPASVCRPRLQVTTEADNDTALNGAKHIPECAH